MQNLNDQNKLLVLLVDDTKTIHMSFDIVFEEMHFLVTHAYSGMEAFAILKNHQFDLIISDLQMPDGDGIWLLENVKKHFSSTPIVIWTAADPVTRSDPRLSRALKVIAKESFQVELKVILETFNASKIASTS